MAHTWPKPVKPIMKEARTCEACGLKATAVKHKHTEHVEYGWVIAWSRGQDRGLVSGLRDLPSCVPEAAEVGR